jgi:hypothetical protein
MGATLQTFFDRNVLMMELLPTLGYPIQPILKIKRKDHEMKDAIHFLGKCVHFYSLLLTLTLYSFCHCGAVKNISKDV